MTRNRTTRRTFIETGGALALGALLAGCSSGGGSGDSSGDTGGSDSSGSESSDGGDGGSGGAEFGGWLSDTSNFDGVSDETGQSEVTVEVGVSGNSGSNAFAPPAVRVDAGTTVVWEWTGNGSHNVVAKNGDFESDYHSEEGATFQQEFSEAGTQKYFCTPHKAMGMKGVVVVE